MKKEIAEKWVAALRSGNYKQTTKRLRREDGFCCLGVLCDIVKDDVGGSWDTYDTSPLQASRFVVKSATRHSSNESDTSMLPPSVVVFADLRWADPRVKPACLSGGTVIGLTFVNDGAATIGLRPHSFEEIADLIEKNWSDM